MITKLHIEGFYNDVGYIKINELLMLKHLILFHPSPFSDHTSLPFLTVYSSFIEVGFSSVLYY